MYAGDSLVSFVGFRLQTDISSGFGEGQLLTRTHFLSMYDINGVFGTFSSSKGNITLSPQVFFSY
jgi:hypothetical protein